MNNESSFKSPAQFIAGGKGNNPPKSPQGFSKKGNGGMDAKTQMAKRKKKKEHKEEKHKHYKHEKKEEKHKMCAKCKEDHKTSEHGKMKRKDGKKHKGFTPKGAHGRAAVHALGRTKTTGNFKKIEESKGKGAAIGAYQNALKAHQSHMKRKAAEKKMTGKELLGRAMKKLKH